MNVTSLKKWLQKYPGDTPRLFLIGGTVRDLLLNMPPKDLDITCMDAREVAYNIAASRSAAIVPMEKKPHTPCYRVVDREDSSNYIDIAEMRGGTIHDDLEQRDFTINAIAFEVNREGFVTGTVDPFNGSHDITQKKIRSVRHDAFISDPLRILRAFRFAAVLNYDIEPSTMDQMTGSVDLLKTVSGERIFSELLLILGTSNSASFINRMDKHGILEVIFPEIIELRGCPQNTFHHTDVWDHSLLTMENCETILNDISIFSFQEDVFADKMIENFGRYNRISLTKLAALLHDIGKPTCREVNPETGRITFYGHDEKGAGLINEIAVRLKMSNQDRDFLALLVAEHLHLYDLAGHGVKASTKMRWFRKMKDDVIPSLIIGMADAKSTLGPDSGADAREDFLVWAGKTINDYYRDIKIRLEKRDLITGRDLIALGMEPGPEMGRILEQIRSAQDTGDVRSSSEALTMARELLAL